MTNTPDRQGHMGVDEEKDISRDSFQNRRRREKKSTSWTKREKKSVEQNKRVQK